MGTSLGNLAAVSAQQPVHSLQITPDSSVAGLFFRFTASILHFVHFVL